jgi:hypothetical protein
MRHSDTATHTYTHAHTHTLTHNNALVTVVSVVDRRSNDGSNIKASHRGGVIVVGSTVHYGIDQRSEEHIVRRGIRIDQIACHSNGVGHLGV